MAVSAGRPAGRPTAVHRPSAFNGHVRATRARPGTSRRRARPNRTCASAKRSGRRRPRRRPMAGLDGVSAADPGQAVMRCRGGRAVRPPSGQSRGALLTQLPYVDLERWSLRRLHSARWSSKERRPASRGEMQVQGLPGAPHRPRCVFGMAEAAVPFPPRATRTRRGVSPARQRQVYAASGGGRDTARAMVPGGPRNGPASCLSATTAPAPPIVRPSDLHVPRTKAIPLLTAWGAITGDGQVGQGREALSGRFRWKTAIARPGPL
jgi:hypothetical protein